MKPDVELRERDGDLIMELNRYPDYDDVSKIADTLVAHYDAVIKRMLDGPSNRVWFASIKRCEIQIHQVEGYGCFLKAVGSKNRELLMNIFGTWTLYD